MSETVLETKSKSWLSRSLKNKQNRALLILLGVFLLAYFVPFSSGRVSAAVQESFLMLAEYARQHVLLCLVPVYDFFGNRQS